MTTKKKEQLQHYAVNTRQIFICPKCERKFFVSGNVSLTCPECKKAEIVPLTKNKQIEQIEVVYCPICHDGDPEVYAGVPGGCFQQCLSCKKVTVGNPGALECPYCGHKKLVESYKAWPVEKVCKKCRDDEPELIDEVEKGDIYCTCTDCGNYSTVPSS